jgi:MerR family mercuric resistance operon transcriptional regulator
MDCKDGGGGNEPSEQWLTTGEMARLSRTTLRTVRFYEAEGLITSREREDGSHRQFPHTELLKLQIISDLREAGLSLQEIKALIALKGSCSTPRQAAGAMSSTLCDQVRELERRIATLQRVRDELSSMVDMLRVCHGCTHPDFPRRCRGCDVVDDAPADRATQLLWKN